MEQEQKLDEDLVQINIRMEKDVLKMIDMIYHSNRTEFGTKAIYSQYGFKTLVIWQYELKDINNVLERIKKFDEQ